MFSLATIVDMNKTAGNKAKYHGKRPTIAKEDGQRLQHIPSLGDYRPKGWTLIDALFVDSSGFGDSSEPALTIDQFYNKVKAGFGYAVIEAGQFQVYIGVFERR